MEKPPISSPMPPTDPRLVAITRRIAERSQGQRDQYLARITAARDHRLKNGNRARMHLSCANQAHAFAGITGTDKDQLRQGDEPSLGIVTAYNDMLSAHQPYEHYPELIRALARKYGGVAMVAGGVPAMCDGITQGEAGMELSLFSRDVIAMAAAVALSHQTFDAAVFLGICDKIVPGLVIAALSFGHLPAIFIPSGPMPSGLPNKEKSKIREDYAAGKVTRAALLEAEAQSYHSPGTCTFYGTANSNQMLMEIMGLHLPGASFVNPNTPLRDAMNAAAVREILTRCTEDNAEKNPAAAPIIGLMMDEKSFVNGMVGLMATGGSTNLSLHLPAMAAAAGITLTWQDFADISQIVPLLARVYPNGSADINQFHQAGGMGFLIHELLQAGLLHGDAKAVTGGTIADYSVSAKLDGAGCVAYYPAPQTSGDADILRSEKNPFSPTGGLNLLQGNLGKALAKVSAVAPEYQTITAPARVFESQAAVQAAFQSGALNHDVVVVVRGQGPRANGMPELHKLIPPLSVLQNRGFKVALVTDGRLSGASGKVMAALHLTPEAQDDSPLARLCDGDLIEIDGGRGIMNILDVTSRLPLSSAQLAARPRQFQPDPSASSGCGRELFSVFRANVAPADAGASSLY
ncbi:MAG: phosphogluconate dehydratase [Candidatus Symbiobacter sp.]|nr:phosphogluconate dehydratase [Candidatus Symbiobacter sp.]